MTANAKKLLSSVLVLPASILLGLGAKVLSLFVSGALFKAWNLTESTLPYAPLWAQRFAALTGNIANLCFLIFFSLPLLLFSGSPRLRFQKNDLLFPLSGMLLSVLTTGVFLLTGSIRMPKARVFPYFGAFVLFALTDLFSATACALLSRKTPRKMFEKRKTLRLILSVLLGTAFGIYSENSFSPVFLLNACLSGILLFILFEKTKSALPEILLLFTFRFFTRFVFGYPDLGGAYPVSEPLLTGGANGVSHSLLLSFYLLILILLFFFHTNKIKKGDSHVSP